MLVRDVRYVRSGDRFWTGADVVVVGPDSPERDLVHNRGDYAEAATPAYRIVEPGRETITVLELERGGYVDCGVYDRGDRASSPALSGCSVDVGSVFDAAGGE